MLKNYAFFDKIGDSYFLIDQNRRNHEKIYLSIFTSLLLMLGLVNVAQADEYLRIGMEAAYAPFNWTQDDDSNGAVKIDGTNQYANGYDVQIAKKIAMT